MIPDARELHRIITASVRELLETARLEAQAGVVDDAQLERLIFRAAAPIVHSGEYDSTQRTRSIPCRQTNAVLRYNPAVVARRPIQMTPVVLRNPGFPGWDLDCCLLERKDLR